MLSGTRRTTLRNSRFPSKDRSGYSPSRASVNPDNNMLVSKTYEINTRSQQIGGDRMKVEGQAQSMRVDNQYQ